VGCEKRAAGASSKKISIRGSVIMSALSRRDLLKFTGSAAAAVMGQTLSTPVTAAMGPADKFDLVIKGGEVLDPSQSLRGKRDIGIRWGVVEAVEADIPAARAENDRRGWQAGDARSDRPALPRLPLWLGDRYPGR
jgi:hypothetical protein